LQSEGFAQSEIQDALAVWDERDEGLRRGDGADSLVAMQRAYAERPWYAHVAFDDPSVLRFIQRIWDFDPVPTSSVVGARFLQSGVRTTRSLPLARAGRSSSGHS